MCGIAGILPRDARAPVPAEALAAMAQALAHRGPDGVGFHRDYGAGLAHTRLSVVDPAGGAQPMLSEDGRYAIVYNGEVYNHVALRRELEGLGVRFRTRCDTEVVLAGYARWGSGLLPRLNGQFAFAILDRPARTVFLCRDRFGICPLYYATAAGGLCFASEPAALFASGLVRAEPDLQGLGEVFSLWAARAPRTVFRGVQALPPGCWASWSGGHLQVRRWYEPAYPAGRDGTLAPPRLEELEEVLRDAVAIRLEADVEVGAYLSGGLDSSLVCALAHDEREGLRTFSVAFEQRDLNEAPYQRAVATHLGTQHARYEVRSREILELLPEVVRLAGTPLLRTGPAPMYLLARLARGDGVPVVLTGEGADEIFLGYDLFREIAVRSFVRRNPAPHRAALLDRLYPYMAGAAGEFWRRSFLAAPGDPDDPVASHLPRVAQCGVIGRLAGPALREATERQDSLAALRDSVPTAFSTWAAPHRAAYLEMKTLMEPYLLSSQGDRMAMAHGVETRYPFLDHRVVELAAALPVREKLAGLREKVALRRMAASRLPATVLARPKQPYRGPGLDRLFRPGAPRWVEELIGPRAIRDAGWWDPTAVAGLLARCSTGRPLGAREAQALMAVVSTQLWHHTFIHGAAPRPGRPIPYPALSGAN